MMDRTHHGSLIGAQAQPAAAEARNWMSQEGSREAVVCQGVNSIHPSGSKGNGGTAPGVHLA